MGGRHWLPRAAAAVVAAVACVAVPSRAEGAEVWVAGATAPPRPAAPPRDPEAMRRLVEAVRPREQRGACFAYSFADLDGDGAEEVLVHVIAPGWCGAVAGCSLWIYRWRDSRLLALFEIGLIRSASLAPRTGPGWRPLYLEKEIGLRRVPGGRRGYPKWVDERNSTAVVEPPADARPLEWQEVMPCKSGF